MGLSLTSLRNFGKRRGPEVRTKVLTYRVCKCTVESTLMCPRPELHKLNSACLSVCVPVSAEDDQAESECGANLCCGATPLCGPVCAYAKNLKSDASQQLQKTEITQLVKWLVLPQDSGALEALYNIHGVLFLIMYYTNSHTSHVLDRKGGMRKEGASSEGSQVWQCTIYWIQPLLPGWTTVLYPVGRYSLL